MGQFITVFLLLGIGYLIKYKKWSWLIAGYNTSSQKEKQKYNVDELCNGVGNLTFTLSAIALFGAFANYFNQSWLEIISWISFVIVIVITIVHINTSNKYKK